MDSGQSDKEDKLDKQRKSMNAYIQYSAMGFQMLAVIAVFAYIGYRIDGSRASDTSLFTAFFSLAGVLSALYLVIRSIKKLNS